MSSMSSITSANRTSTINMQPLCLKTLKALLRARRNERARAREMEIFENSRYALKYVRYHLPRPYHLTLLAAATLPSIKTADGNNSPDNRPIRLRSKRPVVVSS
jgi:hypothetical protein